jgi:hypothetical protein
MNAHIDEQSWLPPEQRLTGHHLLDGCLLVFFSA